MKKIDLLRQEQETTRGAMDWARLEEEIQELLDEEEKDKINSKQFLTWHSLFSII